ncbi:MAG: 3-isopropylmalate dehydratase small subunit [Dehalococcoidales bacterium]|nr:3-isopropylmalate dehydratase small subunit [Dehalococcoidales bacterium]
MKPLRGTVWKFGDDINTDLIAPGRYMSAPIDEMKQHVLEIVNPRFPREVKPGDIIIAGNNFGCGSSREEAPAVLQACGISAFIAGSFARIFFRNAIAIGLPVITCPDISGLCNEGDTVILDIDAATVTNEATGKKRDCESLSEEIRKILTGGGILSLLKDIAAGQ